MKNTIKRIIQKKESKWLILAFAVVIFTLGSYLAAEWRADIADQAMRDKLYRQVVSLAKTVNPEYVSSLSFTIDDLENPVFHRMRNQLANYQSITETRGIYTMVLRNGELIFGPESYAEDDPQASPPGTVYFEPDDLDFSVFENGIAYVFGPVSDEYGTFVSAAAPVVHPRSGEVLMAVGMDIEASDWNAILNRERSIAVLCVLILTLILFGGIYTFQYRFNLTFEKQKRLRHAEVYFVVIFCLALTGIISFLNHEDENSNRKILFAQLAESKFDRILHVFNDLKHNELGRLIRFFQSSEHVAREDFKQYSKPEILSNTIHAIAWAPRVSIDDLNSFQQSVGEEGLDDFIVYQVDGNGKMQLVSERDEYFPLLYVEPFEEQFGAIGFDLASEPTRKAAIDKAILTGMKSATDVIYTVDTNDPVILSIAPLFSDEVIPYYGSDYSLNEHSVSGVLIIALRIDALLTSTDIVGVDNSPSAIICMHQLEEGFEPGFIASSSSVKIADHKLNMLHEDGIHPIERHLTEIYPLFAFGKTYLLAINPGEAFLESYPSRAFCKSFGIGLALTILITAFALVLTNRRLKLETEVQRRTSELKESNERLYSLSEMSRTVTWEVDVNGLYTYISPVCKTAWGYDPEEIVGKKHFYDLFPEEYRETVREEAFALMRQKKALSEFENVIQVKNGYRIWVITYGEPILDDNGDLIGYRGSDIDITQRKLAEKKLMESEERFRTLFMETSASILIHDKDTGEIIDANPAACKMYGLSTVEELKTDTIWFDEPPYTFKDALAHIQKAAADGAHSFEWLNRKVTGELYWDHVYLSPVNINGVQRVMAITLDITDRKRAEIELQMQSKLWRLMMKISSNYINMPSDSVDDAVNASLGELAKFIDADRAYVFNYDFETETCSNTHEWCAEGIEPQIDQLRNVPLEAIPDWVNPHTQGKSINIADVSSLPPGNLRDILEPQDIKSLLTVPMMDKDKCIGFVGFDAVKQHHTYTDIEENLMMIFINMLVNVNHRRQAEEAIRESEERYRDLFTSSRDGIVVTGTDGSIIDANAAYCEMLGYRIEELKKIDFYKITPDKWHEWEREEIVENRLMKVGFSGIYEKEYILKDGSVIPVELQVFIVRDKDRTTKFLWGIVRDITERKSVESALKESETRHRMLFEASQDAMMTVEPPSWKFTSANPAAVRMFGVKSVEEFTNLGPWDITPEYQPDGTLSMESIKNDIQTALNKGSHLFDWMHQRLDGKPVYTQVQLTKMEVSGQIFLQAIVRDVSVQKKSEEALKAGEARMRAITESAQDAVLMMDPDGNISFWNPAAERILGYTSEEVIGKNLHLMLAPEHYHSSCKAAFPHFQNTGEGDAIGKTHELEAVCKDGYVISVELSLSALELSDGWHAVGIMRDITDRKRAEEEILSINMQLHDAIAHANEMAVQAEMANAAKSDFLANMSHEIRTPMNGVIGMIGLLLDTELDKDQRNYAKTVRSSAESLLRLINDILDYSKIEANKLEFELLDFNLSELLDDFAFSFEIAAHQKGIEFSCTADSNVPQMLNGDPGRLRQILTNLTGNAIKFTHNGEVAVRVLVEEEIGADIFLRFVVIDTGIGIPDEKIPVLFDKFFQVDTSTTRKYGGTGLGLAISKELVELMGGEIGVNSKQGKGSKFWFTAKFGKTSNVVHKEKYALTNFKDFRILVVEDNITNQQIALGILKKLGLQADSVADGQEALNMLESIPYDLVLMDIQMPVMDGFKAAKRIRNPESAVLDHDIPVIAMTAHAMQGDKEKCLDAGMNDYISKPVTPFKLHEILSRWLSNENVPIQKKGDQPDEVETIEHLDRLLNWEELVDRLMGDIDFAHEIVNTFIHDMNEQIEKIDMAVSENDISFIEKLAHRLKGSSSNVCSKVLNEIAARMETASRKNDLKTVKICLSDLKKEYGMFISAMQKNSKEEEF